jgi:hypothetical protein
MQIGRGRARSYVCWAAPSSSSQVPWSSDVTLVRDLNAEKLPRLQEL